jgi:hypothetical protein
VLTADALCRDFLRDSLDVHPVACADAVDVINLLHNRNTIGFRLQIYAIYLIYASKNHENIVINAIFNLFLYIKQV